MDRDSHATTAQAPVEFWENRYLESDRIWSGNPNLALVDEAAALPPGRALDLGCGEGADSIWLAERGWRVTGIDISDTALQRARREADARGLSGDIDWLCADLAEWAPTGQYELVSAQFLHSPVELPREHVLRAGAAAVAAGGLLLVVGHASVPPWSDIDPRDAPHLPEADEVLATLQLDQRWTVLICQNRTRTATGPDGQTGDLLDAVVLARRSTD